MKEFLQMIVLAIWTMAAIVTSALALNGDVFYIICGVINLVFSGLSIYKVGKHWLGNTK